MSVTAPQEPDAAAQATPPAIETIERAAAEITRLYAAFDEAAVDLTPDYLKQRLAGEEEVTWAMFPRFGFMGRPTPILDAIMRQEGAILLGAGYNLHWTLLSSYRLTKVTETDAIIVRRASVGFDPGEEYMVVGDQVLKAGYDYHRMAPTVGAEGKLAWSTPRSSVNDTFGPAELDSALQQVIEALRASEPAA